MGLADEELARRGLHPGVVGVVAQGVQVHEDELVDAGLRRQRRGLTGGAVGSVGGPHELFGGRVALFGAVDPARAAGPGRGARSPPSGWAVMLVASTKRSSSR